MSWLSGHRVPRWAAVVAVLGCAVAVVGGFLALAIPPLVSQATALAHHLPQYAHSLQTHNSQLGKLNARYHVEQRLQSLLTSRGR